ncbi:hypothetical protein LzC2_42240 [Planctomycetes bacterium LzC2]|uniref:Uncharacterized protein n=1 Tax=Alienimonas chondri TaxID=2681879 RepID=A0ABX1VJN2_9PLAN|nr:hypothetical protein [Alienimonas chondri]
MTAGASGESDAATANATPAAAGTARRPHHLPTLESADAATSSVASAAATAPPSGLPAAVVNVTTATTGASPAIDSQRKRNPEARFAARVSPNSGRASSGRFESGRFPHCVGLVADWKSDSRRNGTR